MRNLRLGLGFSEASGEYTPPSGAPPVNTVAPALTGSPMVGYILTTDNGTWTNSPVSYTYQWQRAGVDISGETASTYQVAPDDVGEDITCNVTATNADGSATEASNIEVGLDAP